MSTSLQLRADQHRAGFADAKSWSGQNADPININAGQEIAARHDWLLKLVCLEAGEGVAERLEEELHEQLAPEDIGEEGCAAYYDARTSLADLDAEADRLGDFIIILQRFAKAAARACRAVAWRRAM